MYELKVVVMVPVLDANCRPWLTPVLVKAIPDILHAQVFKSTTGS